MGKSFLADQISVDKKDRDVMLFESFAVDQVRCADVCPSPSHHHGLPRPRRPDGLRRRSRRAGETGGEEYPKVLWFYCSSWKSIPVHCVGKI